MNTKKIFQLFLIISTLFFATETFASVVRLQNITNSDISSSTSVTCTLSNTTSGNLLVTTIASDKVAGEYTVPTGFTLIQEGINDNLSDGVSGAMAYKIATGTETSIIWNQSTSSARGGLACWAAEYSGLVSSDVLDLSAQSTSSMVSTTTSISIETSTSTSQDNEFVLAMMACDTYDKCYAARTWSNGFLEVAYNNTNSIYGAPGLSIASKTFSSISIPSTTYTTSSLGDQMYAVIATFKIATSTTPTISIASPTSIKTNSAVLNASIIDDGGASTTIRGFNYGATNSYGSSISTSGTYGNGNYSQTITGLNCGTEYYVQAFSENTNGEGVSSGITFLTKPCLEINSTSVTPSSLMVGTSTSVSVNFTPTSVIPADGKIVVKFPSGFSLNDTASSTGSVVSGLGGSFTTTVSGTDTVILSRPSGIEHVIQISMDGLGSSYLQTQIAAGLAPSFKFLQDNGVYTYNARTDDDVAVTSPSHTGILTGRRMNGINGHNWVTNGVASSTNPSIDTIAEAHGSYVSSIYDMVHDIGLSTGLYVTKDKLASTTDYGLFSVSWNETNGAVDLIGNDDGNNKIDSVYDVNYNSRSVLDKFKIDIASSPFNYSLVHFSDTDKVGHESGWGSEAYQTAITTMDGYLEEILNLINTTSSLANSTVVIVTADHGGHSNTHGDTTNILDYKIPFYVWGPSNVIASNTELYSLNTSSRLDPGTGHPDYSDIDGQPIRNSDGANLALELLGLPPITGSTINFNQDLDIASTSPVVLNISNVKNPENFGQTGYFEIQVQDSEGNLIEEVTNVPKVTILSDDTTAPVISNIGSSKTTTSATITWTTNENSTSVVNYGRSASYGSVSNSSSLTTSHSVTLSGLSSGTTYHYKVSSSDASGNNTDSSDYTFTTSSSGGGGSSGGGSNNTTTVTNNATTSISDLLAQFNMLISQPTAISNTQVVNNQPISSFVRDLYVGSSGNDVLFLQKYLNSNGYIIAVSGPGSVGNESTYFGNLTKNALTKWQLQNGIIPASGNLDLLTRNKINSLNKVVNSTSTLIQNINTTVPITNTGSNTFNRDLSVNSVGEDVLRLQKFLNTHGFVISAFGPGSPGNESTYFGNLTQEALKRFQQSKGIIPVSGYFGPLTRNFINNLNMI
jgi:hypothetical protein